jgi:hypothetical protein
MPFTRESGYLQNMVEDGITFSDRDRDAVEKLRVSNPQSLIDTDFEYSLQNTKWEFLTLCNNYPGVYARSNEPAFTSEQIVSILPSGPDNRNVTVTTSTLPRSPFKIGDSIVLKETANTTFVDGAYIITAVFSPFSFEVVTKSPDALIGDQKTVYTALYTGGFYTNANIPIVGVTALSGTKDALIQFVNPHNLYIKTPLTVVDYSLSAVPWSGTFEVKKVLDDYRVTYETLTGSNYSLTTQVIPASGGVYARTEGVAVHRFFDGGVQINPGTSAPNARIMRQTRKYFKYQSGKSMQFSTGVLFRPVYEVTNAFINRTNFTSGSAYHIFVMSLSSVPYPNATGVYSRTSGGDTTLNGPNGYYIDYGEFDGATWALFSPEEGQHIAHLEIYGGLNSLSGNWTEVGVDFEPAPTTQFYKDKNPDYPYYDFEVGTEQYHGFAQPDEHREGCLIRMTGFETVNNPNDPYNKTFRIGDVLNSKTFQVKIPVDGEFNPFPSVPFSPGGLGYVEVLGWNDATVRTGLFDDQNGMFFEFDGKDLWVVRRFTTTPINGTVSVQKTSPWLVGTNTKFTSQLNINDFVNIQGMSYQVGSIVGDLSATVTPTYRGPNAEGIKVVLTKETRVHQSEFNLDKLDGTGPSGYIFDLNRMQMMFIDYSWYGAGKIRYGIRADKGKIIYFHEIYNNNVNIKAHMRSGNLPGRFEISSTSKIGTMITSLSTNSLSGAISREDAEILPTRGQIVINNEYIKYTKGGELPNNRIQLILNERNAGGLTAGPKIHPANSTFVSYNQNCSPALSHWGVAALMDGEFNEDKSYLFTATNSTSMTATSADQAIISIRLAPSVDYGIIGRLGERNLVNHSLIKPQSIGILANNPVQVNVRVNCEPQNVFANLSAWQFVANGSISQYYDHAKNGVFEVEGTGGDLIASFLLTPEAQINDGKYTSQYFNIDVVRELTNSILGGDFPYPDGPDVVTVSVKTLNHLNGDYNAVCQSRISWTEDQG